MAEVLSRKKIVRACKSRGWMVHAAALTAMHEYFNATGVNSFEEVLEEMEFTTGKGEKLLTEAMWLETIQSIYNPQKKNVTDNMEIINAMDTPRLVYDSMRKTFRVEEKRWSLLGDAADKINVMAQRYALVHQSMLRHEKFHKKPITYKGTDDFGNEDDCHTLTPIESLLGKSNCDLITVLGILVQVEEGKFYLEDTTGRVRVTFADALAMDDTYITENSILIVEAIFEDGILKVETVGGPLVEERQRTMQRLQQQVRHPYFLPCSSQFERDATFVVLSEVHLDQPRVLIMLENLFNRYEKRKPADLPVFCFMGNFSSTCQTQTKEGWEDLATILGKFKSLKDNAHFVFVPGPNDTKSCVLPQVPVNQETLGLQRTMQTHQIPNAHWGSNPCRILQNGKEMVLFRHDALSWILQNEIRLEQNEPDDEMVDSREVTPHSKMARTILQQGHLMPVVNAPIFWNYDHALRLYPLPDALILGGSGEEEEIFGGCSIIHPGTFSKNGTFIEYSPGFDELAEDDDHERMNIDSAKPKPEKRVAFFEVKDSDEKDGT